MSFKEKLKMKLPFTRKGLEDYLDERLDQYFDGMRHEIRAQEQVQAEALFTKLKEEMNLQFHRRINDLQTALEIQDEALFARLKEEMNLQFHRRINDLQMALETQDEALFARLKEEMNLQFHRRTNDLQISLGETKLQQEEELLSQFCQDLDTQLDRRFHYLSWMLYRPGKNYEERPSYHVLRKTDCSSHHKVSIILSLYKGKVLSQSIASIREQTLGEIETILVDASMGGMARELAAACMEENPDMDMVYLYLEEGGLCDGRNAGFQEVTGEYVAFLEEGDALPPGACQAMYYAAQHMKCDLVIGSCMRKDEKAHWYEIPYLKQLCAQTEEQGYESRYEIAIQDPTIWNKLYRLDLLKDRGLRFSGDAPEMDMIFNLRACCCAKNVCTVDTVAYLRYAGAEE